MPRPKATLPEETDEQLEHLVELQAELAKINEEYDRLLLATAEEYGINATARGLGISEYVMHKKIARIRQALGTVQHREAA
jgi:hypothetical protein